MLCHTSLGEVVGTDLLGTVSGTDLALSGLCLCVVLFCQLHLIQTGTQDFQGFILIFQLGFFILAGNHDTAGDMGQTDCGVGGIDTLAAVSGCTEHVKFAVIHIQVEVDFLCFRHNGHGNGGGMDSSARFRLRHTLYTVNPALIFQTGVSSLAGDHKGNFLKSANAVFIQAHHLGAPSSGLCVFYIHPVNFCREQGCFVPAGACTDFHNNVLFIVGVFGQKQDFQLMLQLLNALFRIV